MKTIKYLCGIVCFLFSVASFGQGRGEGWQIDGGIALYSFSDRTDLIEIGGSKIRKSEIVDIQESERIIRVPVHQTSTVVTPPLFVAAGYVFQNSPVGVFLDIYANYAWNNLDGGPSMLYEKELILHFLPEVRLYYMRDYNWGMYASLAAGVRARRYSETYRSDKISSGDLLFSYQLSPIGVLFGRKWQFSFNLGLGRAYSVFIINCGYSF